MKKAGPTGLESVHIGLVERAARWAAAVGLAAAAPLALCNPHAAAGLLLGIAIGLGLLLVHRALVVAWVAPLRRRAVWIGYGVFWVLKWPIVGLLLFLALGAGWVSAGWLCVGVGAAPAAATALVLHQLLRAGREGAAATGGC